MKRIIICAVLMAGAIWASVFAYVTTERVGDELNKQIDGLIPVLQSGDCEVTAAKAAELTAYWEQEEKLLVHFIRHSHIDIITTSMARIPSLAAHGDFGELSAELANIRRQMEHIRTSEKLVLDNLL